MAERTLAENTAQVKADFKGVKDAIFSQVGYDLNGVPTSEYGNKVNDACSEMYTIGKQDGEHMGYETGKNDGIAEAEFAFWKIFTDGGKRSSYNYAFGYADYSRCTIPQGLCKPKTQIQYMFYSYQGECLPSGVDCSEFNSSTASYQPVYMFGYSRNLKRIYDMKIPAVTSYNSTFYYCDNLEEIEIIRCDENTAFNNSSFGNCPKLVKVKFEGTIASDINLQWSKDLDIESLISLFYCLKDFTGTSEAYTKTITLSTESWTLLSEYLLENGYEDHINAQDVIQNNLGWKVA